MSRLGLAGCTGAGVVRIEIDGVLVFGCDVHVVPVCSVWHRKSPSMSRCHLSYIAQLSLRVMVVSIDSRPCWSCWGLGGGEWERGSFGAQVSGLGRGEFSPSHTDKVTAYI